jgi:hypothetical protein
MTSPTKHDKVKEELSFVVVLSYNCGERPVSGEVSNHFWLILYRLTKNSRLRESVNFDWHKAFSKIWY